MLRRALSNATKTAMRQSFTASTALHSATAPAAVAAGAASAVAAARVWRSSDSATVPPSVRTFSSNGTPPQHPSAGQAEPREEDRKTLEAVSQIIERVTELSAGGNDAEARRVLEEEIPCFAEQHGASSLGLAVLQSHLSTLAFYDADYDAALTSAQAQHDIWAEQFGDKSAETAMNDLRLGVALLGLGRAGDAYPLIEAAGAVASQNFQRHVEQHEALSKAVEESQNGGGPAPPAEAILMIETLLSKFGRSVCEARLFRALSALWAAGPSMEADWDNKGEGTVMFLTNEMTEGLQRLMMFVGGDHPLAASFVREHGRLVEHTGSQGLQHVATALKDHHQVLQEALASSPSTP